jgi:hypothetical protein
MFYTALGGFCCNWYCRNIQIDICVNLLLLAFHLYRSSKVLCLCN